MRIVAHELFVHVPLAVAPPDHQQTIRRQLGNRRILRQMELVVVIAIFGGHADVGFDHCVACGGLQYEAGVVWDGVEGAARPLNQVHRRTQPGQRELEDEQYEVAVFLEVFVGVSVYSSNFSADRLRCVLKVPQGAKHRSR